MSLGRYEMARRFQTVRATVALACVAAMYGTAQSAPLHWSLRVALHVLAAGLLVLTAIEQYAWHRLDERLGLPTMPERTPAPASTRRSAMAEEANL